MPASKKIRACLTRLCELAGTSEEAFLQDEDSCALAERHLQVVMQSVIDIGHHLVADIDLGLPEDYTDGFRILAKHKIISEQLGKKLEPMTGMRKVLVHDSFKWIFTASTPRYKTTSATSTNLSPPFSS